MDDVTILNMTDGDLPELSRIFYQSFNDVGERWSEGTATQHDKENFFGECHFIAKINNQIIGYIMGIPLTREQGLELFIDTVTVLPQYQKQGIGSRLWQTMLDHAKEKKYVAIRLLTNPNLHSFDWYKKMGYQQSGWVEIYKGN